MRRLSVAILAPLLACAPSSASEDSLHGWRIGQPYQGVSTNLICERADSPVQGRHLVPSVPRVSLTDATVKLCFPNPQPSEEQVVLQFRSDSLVSIVAVSHFRLGRHTSRESAIQAIEQAWAVSTAHRSIAFGGNPDSVQRLPCPALETTDRVCLGEIRGFWSSSQTGIRVTWLFPVSRPRGVDGTYDAVGQLTEFASTCGSDRLCDTPWGEATFEAALTRWLERKYPLTAR